MCEILIVSDENTRLVQNGKKKYSSNIICKYDATEEGFLHLILPNDLCKCKRKIIFSNRIKNLHMGLILNDFLCNRTTNDDDNSERE